MNVILEQLKKEYRSLLGGMGFGPRPTNFIGLDIGLRYFRAVRIKKTGDEFLVQDKLVAKNFQCRIPLQVGWMSLRVFRLR